MTHWGNRGRTRMRSAARRAMLVILFWSVCAAALAQTSAILTGTVTTRADGLPVPGAVVSLVGTDISATTDTAGKYRLEIPPAYARAGTIQLKVDALGLPPKIYGVEINPSAPNTFDVALSLGFEEQVTVGSRAAGAEAREGGAGRRHHAGTDRLHRLRRDGAGDPGARAVVQFPAADDHRRHRHGAAGDAARPRPRSGAGARQRQAAPPERARAPERQHRPRFDRRRPERDSGLGDRSHRGAARRRRGAVRLGCHRRRHQHRAQGRRRRGPT